MTLTPTAPTSLMTQTAAPQDARAAAQARHDAKMKDAIAALATMKQRTSSASNERKAAARQKVEDLKARIRSLQMSMSGDPKALARAVAQLARELGSAVKAYAAAGGSTAGMGASPAATTGAEASGEAAAGGDVGAGQNAPAPGQTTPSTAETEAEPTETAPVDENATKDETSAKDPYRQVIERQQAQAADQARRNADKEADDKFRTDVKSLSDQLKALLRQAAEKAKREGGDPDSVDQQAADKSLAEVETVLATLASPMTVPAVSVHV